MNLKNLIAQVKLSTPFLLVCRSDLEDGSSGVFVHRSSVNYRSFNGKLCKGAPWCILYF